MTMDGAVVVPGTTMGAQWVDDVLLAGPASDVCFSLPAPVDRGTLRRLVRDRQSELAESGLRAGGAAALRLPPSIAFVTHLLAVWRSGGQAILLDHRLTDYEVRRAIERLVPQVVVSPQRPVPSGLRTFVDIDTDVASYSGHPAGTAHAVVQLSSGSIGPSKVIGRTSEDLIEEILRYTRIDGVPVRGERIVLLPSMVHVLGLVSGLLYGLHAGVELVPPTRLTGDAILQAIALSERPATVLGVPVHLGLLTSVQEPPRLPQFKRMTTGGELVPASVAQAFEDKYGVPLGNMYGMTEVGVIGTDLFGEHRPAIRPVPGIEVRAVDGELRIRRPESPYLGPSDPARWSDGWLRTKDAGVVDDKTGLVSVKGRLDSQVSVDGMKVDLTEVEYTLGTLRGVEAAVVVYDGAITAYLQLNEQRDVPVLEGELAGLLASYKRPRSVRLLDQLPRSTTGKLVRDATVLRKAAP
ncbi:acyl-CoA synthetase (AMP-forming)/AMP-acid ligase II [Kribbella amoyensis]|uniref:Acyl-CoA synthetase (AMP-forming)/AMP-acid ligase II n=1 Tax=Kribbella amoyensis TaxID=996641 RepID=A0A561BKZ1_9ACTN|nr:class I adenylate-forming enzyme family protein [Kribbella amoyensis]TWD79442.1 acyl-CoA synthetase (AMP-forming)/AMP-acid ligase II [Kribbella amoyensis]